jgi:spore coat protein CotF
MNTLQKLTEIGKSTSEKQVLINVNEVFYVWDIMVTKFDIMQSVKIVENFITDIDLKFIAEQVVKGLETGINDMETIMNNYGIPFPERPPVGSNATANIEDFSEKFIYAGLFEGIQSFFPILSAGFMNSTSPIVRKVFKDHLLVTIELQELIVEYGKLKGFINEPPVYKA